MKTLLQSKPLFLTTSDMRNKPSIDMAIGMVVSEEHGQKFWTRSNSGPVTSTSLLSIG